MSERILHVIFVATYLCVVAIRVIGRLVAVHPGVKVEHRESRLSMALLRVFSTLAIGATVAYMIYPRWLGWASFQLPAWARWTGTALMLVSVPLIGWAQWALGKNFSTTLDAHEGHTLVTHGPYRWVRHPMYTITLLFCVGTLLTTANWVIGVPPILALALIVVTRIENEEALMVELFGDEYREYRERTGRFLPRVSRRA